MSSREDMYVSRRLPTLPTYLVGWTRERKGREGRRPSKLEGEYL